MAGDRAGGMATGMGDAAAGDIHLTHGHEHSHVHLPPEHRPEERKRLLLTLALTGVMMVVEVAAGLLTNSLALIGDAGHMLTHVVALSVSLAAIVIAGRPSSLRRTFGFYRTEILAALLNGISVLLISFYIFYEGYRRFLNPEPIATAEMLIVAVAGLVVNLLGAFLLHGVSHGDLNIKSAFLHLIGDTISSVGVIVAGGVIMLTGWYVLDPIVAVLIGVVILIWGFQLIRDSMDILMESVPRGIDIPSLVMCARSHDKRIIGIHDVHVWQITSGKYAMTAHVVVDGGMKVNETTDILEAVRNCMSEHFRISHVAIQFEPEEESCHTDEYSFSEANDHDHAHGRDRMHGPQHR